MLSLAPAGITLRTPVKVTAGVRTGLLSAKNMPACRSRTVPALPRKPRPLVTPHRNSRVCRNEAERAQTVWRSSCRGVYEAVTLPAGICRAPRYRLLIGVPRRVSRAVFEPAHTAPEAVVAIFRITAVDLGWLDDRQPVKRRSFRVSSGSC